MATPWSMRSRLSGGYTLIELLMVMLVMGVLAMLVFPLAEVTVQRDRERELQRALWEIRDAIDAYQRAVDAGTTDRTSLPTYPPNLQALVLGIRDAQGHHRYFLRRIPRDPFADPALPAEQTWSLRSFESHPDHPSPGTTVYDVSSRSTRVGLNGIPLRDW